jgi:hypothetical protein
VNRLARMPSPAMIIAVLALVLGLVGTGIAATQLGRDSVGARELGDVRLRVKKKTIAGGAFGKATAACKRGEQRLGGGATLPGSDPNERPSVEQSGPKGARSWIAFANNDDSTVEVTLRVAAICLKR